MTEAGESAARAMGPEGGGEQSSRSGAAIVAEEAATAGGEIATALAAEGADAVGEAGAAAAGTAGALDGAQLARLREVLVAAHPDAVPELIAGADFDALLGSVAGARAAFARVREEAARVATGGVPRGGGTRELDPAVFAGLSPEGKIAQGLQRR